MPLTLTAVHGVRPQDSGIASALLNAAQQIGVAIGLAIVSTVSVTATAARLPDALGALHHGRTAGDSTLIAAASDALVHGYSTALVVGALVLAAAAVITALLVNAPRQHTADQAAAGNEAP
ncbi:hypothetical protein [Couchioplanes caeruleus]|uniref:Major facilitator superfamily (MFS) profile domain-containing protein n=1 Tax=Couchioplanes caeruleus subsp. caeruleus TaxID=56427 RepID=A0A1K0FI65_9ACTN|nr:hypothetical protein [Couchioplanes caeruleus]OJF12521.1 hypothetical protein BG844_20125 [Couchioplanes caeruleus subsp. caeruleus]